jgi:hypothetical protein
MTTTTIKHKLLSEAIVKHKGDKVTAYRTIYPKCTSDESARAAVSRALTNNPSIKEGIIAVMERQGITEDSLTGKLSEFLDATKDVVTGKGEVVSCRDVSTQMEAVKTGLRLHGHLGTGNNTNVDARSVTINQVSDVQTEQLASVVESLKSMNAQLVGDSDAQTGKIEDVEGIRPVEEK